MTFYTRNVIRNFSKIGFIVVFATTGLVQCGGNDFPVEQLGRARQEIAKAEAQKPDGDSADLLSRAKETLVEGHNLLAEGENKDAAGKATEARKFAVQSRLDSAPHFGLALQEQSNDSLQQADEAFAEKLAADDFQSARSLHQDGVAALTDAESVQVTEEQRNDPLADSSPVLGQLQSYEQAFDKFAASNEASQKARAVALSQKPDMIESVAAVEATLARAKEYGIEKFDEAGYKNTASLLVSARQDIEADKLKSANEKIVGAEGQASALLETARKGKASELVAEAEKSVSAADSDFDRASSKLSAADKVKYGEYMKASQEALDSSKSRIDDEMYEESIQESREAIRLAMLVREGSATSAREMALLEEERRKAEKSNLTDGSDTASYSRSDNEGDTSSTTADETAKSYTVKKTRPAESLWRISTKKYGTGAKWTKIYKANRDKIKNPDLIYPGQEFVIPQNGTK